jgi:hypothetical protein
MPEQLPIQIERCKLTRCGAEFQKDLTISEWMGIGQKLNSIGSCYQFLLGDWVSFGERAYGEKYAIACEESGLERGTLMNYAWVCSKIEISRRREVLCFGHHQEVAPLSEREQDKWLDRAAQNKWSVSDLRAEIRKASADYAGEDHGKPVKSFVGYLTNAIRLIGQQRDQITAWTPEQRFQTKELLKPIVEFYGRL